MALGTTYQYSPTLRMMDLVEAATPLYHAQVALERGWVTVRDLHMLTELAASRFLTRSQIRHLCYEEIPAERTVQRRLQQLHDHGLITQVQWVVPSEPPRMHYAYSITLNGAMMLRDYYGHPVDWKPGMSKKHLKVILAQLAANEFRLQVVKEPRTRALLSDWKMHAKTDGPVASFRLGDQLFVLDCPRDEEDAFTLRADRYTRWDEQQPIILLITPHERAAAEIFERFRSVIAPERMLFTTDQRAFECPLDAPGYLWTWHSNGRMETLALLEPAATA